MKNAIYPKYWLQKSPYSSLSSADTQYMAFANKIYDLLARNYASIPGWKRKTVAIAIASYIEDKQSDLGLFSSYVAMTRRESEAQHPFDAMFGDVVPIERIQPYIDEYDDDKVNVIDLAFLLAQSSIEFADEADTHFAQAKTLLAQLQDMHYEQLPSNDESFNTFCDLLELEGWDGLTTFLLWLSQKSYFLSPVTASLATEMFSKEVEDVYGPACKYFLKACQLHQVFSSKFYKLGVRPVTFAEEFARRADLDSRLIKDLEDVEMIEPLIYEIKSVTRGAEPVKSSATSTTPAATTSPTSDSSPVTLTLLGLSGTEYTATIDKSDHTHYVTNTCATGKLLKYGATWHFLAPPRILHRPLTADERKAIFDEASKKGEATFRHR